MRYADPDPAIAGMNPPAVGGRPQGDTYLTIDQALQCLKSMGFYKITRRQVVRWAAERTLPFFRQGKCLYIAEHELRMWFRRRQIEAVNEASRR